jgi:hypothetical protein
VQRHKVLRHVLVLLLALVFVITTAKSQTGWSWQTHDYTLGWDLHHDVAQLVRAADGKRVFSGPLLPGFWLQLPSGERRFVKAEFDSASGQPGASGGTIGLRLPGVGSGTLRFSAEPWGIEFEELRVTWSATPPAVIGLYFGSAPLTVEEESVVPSLDLPFWPRWSAEGYCVPSGKGGPVQSFFRNWDMGQANFPLGNFGPSLGTPYAAAFPRPVLSSALGGREGWVAFGPGSIPDAALMFEIRSSTSTLHYLYREDLWGAPTASTRVWSEPLRLAWAPTAWDAFRNLFASFAAGKAAAPIHQQAFWNTWGNFKDGNYDLRLEADQAAAFGAKVLVIDEGWESNEGSGNLNRQRFPQFAADLAYIHSEGLEVGFWEAVGWVADAAGAGLTADDLLVGLDKQPRKASWNMAVDSVGTAHYCLDPSSLHTREFLRRRTIRVMREFSPQVLKLDFGYGLPGPDVAAPRNPEFRGERYAFELLKIIVSAAREVNPDVTIQYYGIHPLMRPVTDVVALDDLGDAGGYEAEAHGQWSIWSALAAAQGTAIMASSGYDWKADSDVLLDTAVIGAPGSVLPLPHAGEPPLPESWVSHRRALARWYRRTTGWGPLWLNSDRGSIGHESAMRTFGRMERIEGEEQLTALALRAQKPEGDAAKPLRGMQWEGRWALISQDNASIFSAGKLACIPFDGGFVEIPLGSRPVRVLAVWPGREEAVNNWTFSNGRLHLEAGTDREGIMGFLVIRDQH